MATQKKQTMSIANQTDKDGLSSNEELVKRTEVGNTPFMIITIDGKSFGIFGKYKITEDYTSIEECENELHKITWNRIVQIMTLIHEILTNNNK